MVYQSEIDTQVISLRINRNLLAQVDRYSREQALIRDKRVTRNNIIEELLEVAMSAVNSTKEDNSESHHEQLSN